MSAVRASSAETFSADVTSDGITIVDFWASWCGPCRSFGPIFESSAALHPDVSHLKVDVDANSSLAALYDIRSIPTTMFMRDGIVVGRFSGALSAPRLLDLLEQTRRLDMNQIRGQRE